MPDDARSWLPGLPKRGICQPTCRANTPFALASTGRLTSSFLAINGPQCLILRFMKINTHQKAATTRQVQRLFEGGNPRSLPGIAGLRGFAGPGRSQQPADVAVQRRSRAGHQLAQFHARQGPTQRHDAREADQSKTRREQHDCSEQQMGVEREQG